MKTGIMFEKRMPGHKNSTLLHSPRSWHWIVQSSHLLLQTSAHLWICTKLNHGRKATHQAQRQTREHCAAVPAAKAKKRLGRSRIHKTGSDLKRFRRTDPRRSDPTNIYFLCPGASHRSTSAQPHCSSNSAVANTVQHTRCSWKKTVASTHLPIDKATWQLHSVIRRLRILEAWKNTCSFIGTISASIIMTGWWANTTFSVAVSMSFGGEERGLHRDELGKQANSPTKIEIWKLWSHAHQKHWVPKALAQYVSFNSWRVKTSPAQPPVWAQGSM